MYKHIIFLLLLLCFSCSKSPTHFKGLAHTHPYHVQLGHLLSSGEKKEVEELLSDIFKEVDRLYSLNILF